MKWIVIISLFTTSTLVNPSYNFGKDCTSCNDWFVVLDGVMGGLSTGALNKTQSSFILSGTISLENNGGFASLRTAYQNYDLSSFQKVKIKYRSTGQDFGFTLNKYRRFWFPNYKANLPQTNGEWKEVALDLKEFDQYRLGKRIKGNPSTKDLSEIIRLGFISNTKAESSYEFEVDYIRFE